MPDIGYTFCTAIVLRGEIADSGVRISPTSIGIATCATRILAAATPIPATVVGGLLPPAQSTAIILSGNQPSVEMDTYIGHTLCRSSILAGFVDLNGIEVDTPIELAASPSILINGRMVGPLRSEIKRLSLVDVALQVYALWGYQLQSLAQINIGLPAITAWTNAAMQLIYANADRLEYFSKNTKTITVSTSGEVTLDSSIQRVLGSVRLAATKKTLRMLPSLEALEQFSLRFLDDTVAAPSAPLAYYIDSSRADGPDSVALTLYVIPAPEASVDVLIEVCDEPPRYEPQDFYQGTPLQLPHKWAETILLPLVKQWALGDTLMPASLRDGVKVQIGEQYDAARAMLGMATTDEPAKENAKPKGAASQS